MGNRSRLARILGKITEVSIALVIALGLGLVVVAFLGTVSGASWKLPTSFTPDEDTYRLTSPEWGEGVIEGATGTVTFFGSGLAVAAVSAGALLVYLLPALAILILLKRMFHTMASGYPFEAGNGKRIRQIGFLVIFTGLAGQVLNWVSQAVVMDRFEADGLHLMVNIEPKFEVLFLGLVILALAEVFEYGNRLQVDSDLTV